MRWILYRTLFLIPILHQTTTSFSVRAAFQRCFSFQFYIKPQLWFRTSCPRQVVSHSNSTSNHNTVFRTMEALNVVSHSNSTSNHNGQRRIPATCPVVSHSNSTSNHNRHTPPLRDLQVVSHSNSTSNHNSLLMHNSIALLFLIPILHQTTTSRMAVIHILHVTHMTPMHKTSCRTPGKLVGCNFVFQRAIYQKNSSC